MPYLSYFKGENLFIFPQILLVTLLYSFPLGYAVARFSTAGRNHISRIVIAFGLGIPATATVWSLMVWFSIPFQPYIFLGAVLIISVLVFSLSITSREQEPPTGRSYYAILLLILLLSYWLATHPQINKPVPGGTDGQLHGYIQVLLKHTGKYTPLKLYPSQPDIPNYYPPGFHVFCVMTSMLTGISITKAIMGTGAVLYVVLCIFIFELLYLMTGRLWAASLGVVFAANRIYLFYLIYNAQFPELMAVLACAAFFYSFSRVLQKNDWRNVVTGGLMLGACGAIHSRFLLWLSLTLLAYLFSRCLAKPKPSLKEQLSVIAILLEGLLINLPLFLINIREISLSSHKIYRHQLFDDIMGSLARIQGWPVTVILFVSLAVFLWKRDRISLFLATWVLVMLFQVGYWRVLQLFSFPWFSISPSPATPSVTQFTDIFPFSDPDAAIYYGLAPLLPFLAALTAREIFRENRFSSGFRKAGWFGVFLLLCFVYTEKKAVTAIKVPRPPFKDDISVLEKLKRNTTYDQVFLFTPPTRYDGCLNPGYRTTCQWAPVITERRTLFFNNINFVFHKYTQLYDPSKMDKIYFNIGKHYAFLKKNRISHLFVPTLFRKRFERNGIPDFLEKQYSVNQAVIYLVQGETDSPIDYSKRSP
ncbi:MAG: hypothetical protein ACE5GM_04680 [bacterium]